VAYQGGIINETHVSPSLARFMTMLGSRLDRRLQFYSTISTQRIGGYLTTFFADTNLTSQSEQLFDFLYLFPYSVEAAKRHLQLQKLSHPHHKSAYDQIKVKRRLTPFFSLHSRPQVVCVGRPAPDLFQVSLHEADQGSHHH
jgi:hypothetical protein